MSIQIIQTKLDSYNCKSQNEEEHAVREITQEVIRKLNILIFLMHHQL